MPDVDELGDQILGLFKSNLQRVHEKLSAEDRQNLAKYSHGIAKRTIQLRHNPGPVEQAKLRSEIEGFSGAIALMTDRYLLLLNHEAEKVLLQSMKATASWLVKIVVTAAI
jgi:hypothetical protein